jgi:hypothetical protein
MPCVVALPFDNPSIFSLDLQELWRPHPNWPNERAGPNGENGWGWMAWLSEGGSDPVGVLVKTGASKQLPADVKEWIRQLLEGLVDREDPRTLLQQVVDAAPVELLLAESATS